MIHRTSVFLFLGLCCILPTGSATATEMIGAESAVALPTEAHFIRYVYFRPVNGARVRLNPPRFSWSYNPFVDPKQHEQRTFRFQIAGDPKFTQPLIDQRCEYNFYNALAPLKPGNYYWRVGYLNPDKGEQIQCWSQVRSFTILPDAVPWDRSMLADWEYLKSRPHPRLLLNKAKLGQLRQAIKSDPASTELFRRIIQGTGKRFLGADKAMTAKWWSNPEKAGRPDTIGERLELVCCVAFAWHVTGEEKYIQSRPQDGLVRLAELYVEKGLDRKDNTRNDYAPEIVFIGLGYDWLHEVMTDEQRQIVVRAIERNADWIFNHFWWRRVPGRSWSWNRERGKNIEPSEGKHVILPNSAAKLGGSHTAEVLNKGFYAILAAYDEPQAKWTRKMFEVGMNYYIANPYPFGTDQGYNEGSGYITSILPQIADVAVLIASAFPELQIQKNPHYASICRFMRHQLPVGIEMTPWGHGFGKGSSFAVYGRLLAHLADDGAALSHWQAITAGRPLASNIFVSACLPAVLPTPEPALEKERAALFPWEGWVMAHSQPPSAPNAVADGVGMVFHCRPRGGCYSHSLASDLSFQLYAYGQSISHASGGMWNKPYSNHSISHNSILVDGMGQAQAGYRGRSTFGRIVGFKETPKYVYACGDATYCYPHEPFVISGWWGRFSLEIYGKRDVNYLKKVRRHLLFVDNRYFVIYDELKTDPTHPATFTWLYHIVEDTLKSRPDDPTYFLFSRGDVKVHLVHVAHPDSLDVLDLKGRDGYANPLTGESYRGPKKLPKQAVIPAHHLWISNRDKASQFNFMTVVYPVKPAQTDPQISRVDNKTVEVVFGNKRDLISFDRHTKHDATIIVDPEAIDAADNQDSQ